MARTTVEINSMRREIAGSAIAHTNDPLTLENGESISVSYSIGDANPTVTINATLKIAKTYEPTQDAMIIAPYELEVDP